MQNRRRVGNITFSCLQHAAAAQVSFENENGGFDFKMDTNQCVEGICGRNLINKCSFH